MADKEVEDHNAFSRWDSVGAIAMLASFPAVVTFVFNDHDIKGALVWAVVAAAAAGVVFLLSLIIKERFLNKIVNFIGWGVTLFFVYWGANELLKDIAELGEDPAITEKKQDSSDKK